MAKAKGWLIDQSETEASAAAPEVARLGGTDGRNLNYSLADLRAWYQQQSTHYLQDGVDFWWNDEVGRKRKKGNSTDILAHVSGTSFPGRDVVLYLLLVEQGRERHACRLQRYKALLHHQPLVLSRQAQRPIRNAPPPPVISPPAGRVLLT